MYGAPILALVLRLAYWNISAEFWPFSRVYWLCLMFLGRGLAVFGQILAALSCYPAC